MIHKKGCQPTMTIFIETKPKDETLWRAIILFGRNVASYKFALGKALIELAEKESTFVKLGDLAEPFTRYLIDHLRHTDKQGVSKSSRFLDACRDFERNKITKDVLISKTVQLGFNNVIDAFHIVGNGEVPKRFFIDDRQKRSGITITDDLLALKENVQFSNLPFEVEARWRLVETAWSLNISPSLLEVKYDADRNLFFTESDITKRINITSCRDSLNGYQKGKCFYCNRSIVIGSTDQDLMADVDHFFPHALISAIQDINLDGIWNLVLSCQECNRGEKGKFANVPKIKYLERLFNRNEFFIQSHHPLRETLINQTGKTEKDRQRFLQQMDTVAIDLLVHRWEPSFDFNEDE
jgi:hypothetical protein